MVAWTKTEGNPVLRTGLAIAALVSFGLLTFAWWPSEPIQPGERGTVQDSLEAIDGAVQDGLETVEENLLSVRPGLAAEEVEDPEDAPVLQRLVGVLSWNSASENGASEPVRRIDKPVPAGEQPPGAQPGEQDTAPREATPSGEQDAQPSSQPADDPDYAPVPSYTPQPSAGYNSGSGGYSGYDRGDDGSGYDRGGSYSGGGSYDGGGSGYDRSGSGYDSGSGSYDSGSSYDSGGSRSGYDGGGSNYDGGGDSRSSDDGSRSGYSR